MKTEIIKHIRLIFKFLGMLFGLLVLHGCSDNEGPGYEKMRPSRMDIAGAESIGFIDGQSASNGETLLPGLYKIDANGNVSSVAVYFTKDKYGNQIINEDEVVLRKAGVCNAGNDYILFYDCEFEDLRGGVISKLPPHILVRKSDGKMWNLSEKSMDMDFSNTNELQFYQAYNGTLYYGKRYKRGNSYIDMNPVYKVDMQSEQPAFEQITDNNMVIRTPYAVDSKGIVCGNLNTFYFDDKPKFLWPNSGFREITGFLEDRRVSYSYFGEDIEIIYNPYKRAIVNFHGQFYAIQCPTYISTDESYMTDEKYTKYTFLEFGLCNKFSTGNNSGNAAIDYTETISLKNDMGLDFLCIPESILVTSEYILTANNKYGGYNRITALNPQTEEWKWLANAPDGISFNSTYHYNNRYWIRCTVDGSNGVWWFNPDTLESGFVAFITIPSYLKFQNYYRSTAFYSGVNPANGQTVEMAVNLMTGNAVTDINTPEYLFSSLIPLN